MIGRKELTNLIRDLRTRHAGPRTTSGLRGFIHEGEADISRRAVIERAAQAARFDRHTIDNVQSGDGCRDRGAWAEAAAFYRAALDRSPLLAGCRVQYAHMRKELGELVGAELHYRGAIADGAPLRDVVEHLDFVCDRTGGRRWNGGPPDLDQPLRDAGAGIEDIATLAYALWPGRGWTEHEALELLRPAPTLNQLAQAMMTHRYFEERNGRFLAMIGQAS
jgi:hypothetical protein